MRIGKKKIQPPKPIIVKIFREDDDGQPANVEFVCGAVLSYEEFEKMVPVPKAPLVKNVKTGQSFHDENHPRFKKDIQRYAELKVAWMVLKSLSSTPDLEWDKVDLINPDTWLLYVDELKEFLTPKEIDRVQSACIEANSPTEKRREEALGNFSRSQEAEVAQDSFSQEGEPTNTTSTEPVKDLESSLQA